MKSTLGAALLIFIISIGVAVAQTGTSGSTLGSSPAGTLVNSSALTGQTGANQGTTSNVGNQPATNNGVVTTSVTIQGTLPGGTTATATPTTSGVPSVSLNQLNTTATGTTSGTIAVSATPSTLTGTGTALTGINTPTTGTGTALTGIATTTTVGPTAIQTPATGTGTALTGITATPTNSNNLTVVNTQANPFNTGIALSPNFTSPGISTILVNPTTGSIAVGTNVTAVNPNFPLNVTGITPNSTVTNNGLTAQQQINLLQTTTVGTQESVHLPALTLGMSGSSLSTATLVPPPTGSSAGTMPTITVPGITQTSNGTFTNTQQNTQSNTQQ